MNCLNCKHWNRLPVRDTQGKVVEPGYKAQTLFDIEPEIRGYRNSYEEW